jgi:hypothetical protein
MQLEFFSIIFPVFPLAHSPFIVNFYPSLITKLKKVAS